jgi:TonB-dependent starch-binding outer membrane protein SusC
VKKIENFFPSVALSYDLSKEYGINQLSWFNKFMLSFSFGRAGNFPLNALSKDLYNVKYYYYFDDTIIKSKMITQFANHYIKPEMVSEYNYGFIINLFDNRLKSKLELYNKTVNDLAIIRDIPAYYGGGKAMLNIGKVTNSGIEISLDIEPVRTQNFSWFSSFVFSKNKQRVKNLGNVKKMDFANYDPLIPQFEVALNEEVGVIKGYKYLGSWTTDDTNLNDKHYVKVGGGKYLKSDTVSLTISDKDLITLGKTLPDYTWHWDNQFLYKNFSIEILWYAVIGVDKYNGTKASTYMSGLNADVAKFVERGDNSPTSLTFYRSSYFVEDASFVRMKRLTFTYSFPKKVFQHVDLKLSLSFENLITYTKYTGYDPEASIYTDNSFSDLGVDRGAYPNPRSVFFSLMLGM